MKFVIHCARPTSNTALFNQNENRRHNTIKSKARGREEERGWDVKVQECIKKLKYSFSKLMLSVSVSKKPLFIPAPWFLFTAR